ncbi:MAG: hypothetical protein Q4F30_09860 [Akkermansia sp.]|nr:hypothetical protein [Akkermansia sp.]
MPTARVSLKESPVRAIIAARITSALDRMAGPVPHDNHDAVWRPSRWDVDAERTIRHTMATTAEITRTRSGLALRLTYTVNNVES